MPSALTFISPGIIERLENGSFVPARKTSRRTGTRAEKADRRDRISPLSVTKRCIRYDPNVFYHRTDSVLEMAYTLNDPRKKILLVGGPQGSGKTSLVRGVIELMGSQNEQLLWFDVSRHTDFEEIIQFLIQYITYVCTTAEQESTGFRLSEKEPDRRKGGVLGDEPLRKLETLINRVKDMPLLLVLDNVEFIVDPELRFNSYPFKEMLNFLLDFPNIKMVLIGERLPYADMSPNQDGVADLKLGGLHEQDAVRFMLERRKTQVEADPGMLEMVAPPEETELTALRQLYLKTHGYPWLLKLIFYLNHHSQLDFYTLNRMLENEADSSSKLPIGPLVRFIYERLPDQQRKIFQIMSFMRHPVNARTLQALAGVCFPVIGPSILTVETVEDIVEHSLIKPVLKISYPPQEVLEHIRYRNEHPEAAGGQKYKPWYELYHAIKRILYHSLPAEERERIHGLLQDFYLREKGQEADGRIVRIKNRALLSEAKFHGSAARSRKPTRPAGVEVSEMRPEVDVPGQAYLYRHVKPIASQQHFGQEDFAVGASGGLPDEAETSLDGPTFMEMKEKGSFQEMLSGLELSEEEKSLLYSDDEDKPIAALPSAGRPPLEKPPARIKNLLEPEFEEKAPKPAAIPEPTPKPAQPQDLHSLTAGLMNENEDEQEKVIQKRLAAAVASRDKPSMVRELLHLAKYRAGHGRYASAGQCLEKALSLNTGGKEVMAEVYRLSGSVNKETFHHNAALNSLSKAAVSIKRLMYEDDTVDAVWLGRLGQVYQDLGEIQAYRKQGEEALEAFTQALRWYHSADDELHQAEIFFQMADVYDSLGRTDEAIAHYEKALTIDEEHHLKLSAAAVLTNLGSLYLNCGREDDALRCFARCLTYDRELENVEGQLNTLDFLANIYLRKENWPKAEQACQQALTLAMQEGAALWKATFYMKLGQLSEAQQGWQQAVKYFELAKSSGEAELSQESLKWIREKIDEAKLNLG